MVLEGTFHKRIDLENVVLSNYLKIVVLSRSFISNFVQTQSTTCQK